MPGLGGCSTWPPRPCFGAREGLKRRFWLLPAGPKTIPESPPKPSQSQTIRTWGGFGGYLGTVLGIPGKGVGDTWDGLGLPGTGFEDAWAGFGDTREGAGDSWGELFWIPSEGLGIPVEGLSGIWEGQAQALVRPEMAQAAPKACPGTS